MTGEPEVKVMYMTRTIGMGAAWEASDYVSRQQPEWAATATAGFLPG